MGRLSIDADSWAVLNRLLDEALDLPVAERARWLDTLPSGHDTLKPHLRDLLLRVPAAMGDSLDTLPKLATAGPGETEPAAGDRVGGYTLVRELARGGMGVVWLAARSDGMINRPVALKLPRGTWERPALAARMAREREILASLNHPNIARLYDAGLTTEGLPYLALEYVEGRRIDEYCREKALPLRQRLELFVQTARAVAHAHGRLVIHRDLKPSNILVTDDGQARLLDFGIARILEVGRAGASDLTRASGRAFTPDYASPEQIAGGPVATASDIYSLGVVLFEMLTGSRPYRIERNSAAAMEEAILLADPAKASAVASDPAVRRALRGDLDTIIRKALKKKPEDRYATVEAMVADIERHLGGWPVLAQPDSRAYRARKFVARHRLPVAAAAAVLVTMVAGATISFWQARIARAEQRRAERVKDFVVSVFAEADPYRGEGGPITATRMLGQARDRIRSTDATYPGLRAELLNLVASGFVSLGDPDAADESVQAALADARSHFGEQHRVTLESRLLATDVDALRGRTDEARGELDALIPILRASTEIQPALLVHALVNLAIVELDDGNHAESEKVARQALDLAVDRLDPRDPRRMEAGLTLAQVFIFTGSLDDSQVRAVDEALRVVVDVHGDQPRNPFMLEAREIRAQALGNAGRFHEALAELETVKEDLAATFGPRNMLVAHTAGGMAFQQIRLGRIGPALESTELQVSILTEHTDRDSWLYGSAVFARGLAFLSARRGAEALRDLEVAEKSVSQALGPNHVNTLVTRGDRAVALAYLGRVDDAREALRALREMPPDNPKQWIVLGLIGCAERVCGDPAASFSAYDASMDDIAARKLDDWERLRSIAGRGLAAVDLGRHDVAWSDLSEADRLFTTLATPMHPAWAEVRVGLGRIELERGNAAAALAHLESADAYWRDFDPDNRWAGESAFWLGRGLAAAQRNDAAQAAFARARAILARSPIPLDAALLDSIPAE